MPVPPTPSIGWGRVALLISHFAGLPIPGPGGCSWGTSHWVSFRHHMVTESLLGSGSPGGIEVAPLGVENCPGQSSALGNPTLGPSSETRAHAALRRRASMAAGTPRDPSLE